jgi:Hemerythrin HHE cation binding domain
MSDRENLFRPIHKGIRSMLFELGHELQTTDFADETSSNRFVTRLKHDLGDSLSNCILCLLKVHSTHEEKDIFSRLRAFDPDAVDLVMKEHGEAARRIWQIAKTCDELLGVSAPARRIEVGDRLNQEVNELFAFYLSHLNNEDATLVPLLWERFTDEQLRAIRAEFYDSLPLPLFETWMRWTLPSLNQHELVVLFSGLKKDPTPRLKDWERLAHETLTPDRWLNLSEQVGIESA